MADSASPPATATSSSDGDLERKVSEMEAALDRRLAAMQASEKERQRLERERKLEETRANAAAGGPPTIA